MTEYAFALAISRRLDAEAHRLRPTDPDSAAVLQHHADTAYLDVVTILLRDRHFTGGLPTSVLARALGVPEAALG